MSDIATPTEATRTGPPPANVPGVAKPQPCDVETQGVDGDDHDGEDQPLLNASKSLSIHFNTTHINSSTARDSTPPSNAQLDAVLRDEPDDHAGSTPAIPPASLHALAG